MFYGDEKPREMMRSILPSTRRYSTWEKKRLKRAQRSRTKQALRDYCKEALYDDDEGCWSDDSLLRSKIGHADQLMRRDQSCMVSERRAADKINHFVRWAEAKTSHIPEEDVKGRYHHFIGVVGGATDVIREHAIGHFIGPWEFNTVVYPPGRWRRRRYKPDLPVPREELHDALLALIDSRRKGQIKKVREFIGSYKLRWKHCMLKRDRCVETVTTVRWRITARLVNGERKWCYQWVEKKPDASKYIFHPDTKVERVHHWDRCNNKVSFSRGNLKRLMELIYSYWGGWSWDAWARRVA